MSRNEDVPLQDSVPSDAEVQDLHGTEQNAFNLEQQVGLSRKRACALVGCAILQFPIWGFAMSYGVFQEYFSDNSVLQGNRDLTGIVGTTSNGVMYLSMPFLFALFSKRWARWRRTAAVSGAAIMGFSFLLSSFSTQVWHLVATQGVMAALGCALIYSPTTLSLGEWFNTGNRALAYGVVLSCKNIVGSLCPFMFRALLNQYGFRVTLRAFTAIATVTSILSIFLVPNHPSSLSLSTRQARRIPWLFLKHQTFYIYSIATMLQSCGYGIPQTYLGTYAHEVSLLSHTEATFLLTLFNIPGIASSFFFGYLGDRGHFSLSASTITAISCVSSALSAFLFWGLTSQGSIGLLVMFSVTFGFFAGGYSAAWGGIINEMEHEAGQKNEAIDLGLIYGLLNGARGIGYVTGGLASIPLLKVGRSSLGNFAYG